MGEKQQIFINSLRIKNRNSDRRGVLKAASYCLCDIISDKEFEGTDLYKKATSINKVISKKLSEYDECLKERINILSQTLGKYWEVKEYNGKDRKVLYSTRLIYPYRMIMTNNTFWYIEGIVEDNYNSGMRSCTVDCYSIFNNCLFTEITKEEFIKRVNEHCDDVLISRLEKIKTRNEHMIK